MIFYRIHRRLIKSLDWLRGWLALTVLLPAHKIFGRPIRNINTFEWRPPFIERKEYAQNQEDGIILAIFAMIGTTNKFYVEFGVEDGVECNTRYLWKHRGWTGLMMDGSHKDGQRNLRREFITAENIEELFRKYDVPEQFDLLSIDIDGNDYWVWQAIQHFQPRVVIIEYNAHFPPNESKTIPYNPSFAWDKTDYLGASLLALKNLGEQKGYTLIGTDSYGVNAFFVRSEIAEKKFSPPAWPGTYHPPRFKGKRGAAGRHPPDMQNRPWETV